MKTKQEKRYLAKVIFKDKTSKEFVVYSTHSFNVHLEVMEQYPDAVRIIILNQNANLPAPH